MRKVFLLFVAASFAWMAPTKAQNTTDRDVVRCYTMEADEQLRIINPELGTLDEFEQWLAPLVEQYKAEQANQEGNRINAVTTIPIIFHVIHNGEAVGSGDNISATYINAQITQLNNDFRRVSGTSGFNNNPVGADTEVEFCAATVDPNGATLSTPGINRINRNSKGWTAPPYGTCTGGNFGDAYIEGTIKPQSQWDPTKYLNIWVMNMTCGILGYAQFPSNSGLSGLNTNGGAANTDGVVILGSSVGSTTTPNPAGGAYNKGRTLTHEIGHWIGLRHIWGDGGCSVDDFCNDTPTSDAANFGCPTTHVSCGSTDMVQNYMDYTDDACMNIFTADQKARMMAVLANSPRRSTLGASNGCGTGGGGGSCTTTITSFPYAESFESGTGAWSQGSGDDFDWSRNSGGTPSSGTGPTAAAAGSWYMFTESSSPNYPSKRSYLDGPCFNLSSASAATFGFQYHMSGAAMGTLTLEVSTNSGSTWTSVWTASGDKGTSWLTASVNLGTYVGSTIKLRFNGLTSTSFTSDMAIDNLSFSTSGGGGGGSCTGGITSFPYTESFESSFGQWAQGIGDDFDWLRRSGGTPSSGTGPSAAAAGTFYAYVEASSPNYPSKQTFLNSPCFNLTSASQADFSFQYHMYGIAAMGSLILQASTNNGSSWTTVWSRTGNQGNSWQTGTVSLAAYTGGSVQLRFVGTTTTSWQGDIAVDDISLTTGGGGCSTVNISITFDNYPGETSWEIRSGATVVASGGPYGSQAAGSTLNLSECLAAGCYDFVINDSYGDGICCAYGNGSYTVTNGSTTLASGGSFTSSQTTNFCVNGSTRDPQSAASVGLGEGLDLFPNPANSTIHYAYESATDAQAMLRIADMTGRVLVQMPVMINAGMNQQAIDVQELPAGSYMMSISHQDVMLSKRFVVVK